MSKAPSSVKIPNSSTLALAISPPVIFKAYLTAILTTDLPIILAIWLVILADLLPDLKLADPETLFAPDCWV